MRAPDWSFKWKAARVAGLATVGLFVISLASPMAVAASSGRACKPSDFAELEAQAARKLYREQEEKEAAIFAAHRKAVEPTWDDMRAEGHPMAAFMDDVLPKLSDPETAKRGNALLHRNMQSRLDAAAAAKGVDIKEKGYKLVRIYKNEETGAVHYIGAGETPPAGTVEDSFLDAFDFFQLKANGMLPTGAPKAMVGIPMTFHDAGHIRPFVANVDLMVADREFARAVVAKGRDAFFDRKVTDLGYLFSETPTSVRAQGKGLIRDLAKSIGVSIPRNGFVKFRDVESHVARLSNADILSLFERVKTDFHKMVEPVGGFNNDLYLQFKKARGSRERAEAPAAIVDYMHRAAENNGLGSAESMAGGTEDFITLARSTMPETIARALGPTGRQEDQTAVRNSLAHFITAAVNGMRADTATLMRELAGNGMQTNRPGTRFHDYFCASGNFVGIDHLCRP